MKDCPGLHLKTNILILFIVLFAPLGNVLLSKGMKRIGSAKNWVPGDIFHILLKIVTSGYIWLGIACLLIFFVAYMLVLTWADYSYVQQPPRFPTPRSPCWAISFWENLYLPCAGWAYWLSA